MMNIICNNYFSDDELNNIRIFIEENSTDFELKVGMNYAVDVSDIIGRTANVDIEII